MVVYAPERSFLLIAAAPSAEWPALREILAQALASFRPAGGRR
jgi:hypothetical protein